jgi:hypothetical protein
MREVQKIVEEADNAKDGQKDQPSDITLLRVWDEDSLNPSAVYGYHYQRRGHLGKPEPAADPVVLRTWQGWLHLRFNDRQ